MLTVELLQLLVFGGPGMVLLGVVLLWYLPQRDKHTAQTIQRIHNEDHQKLGDAINANSRQTNKLARAVLVVTFTGQGMDIDEAERRAREIVANGDSL